MMGDKLTALGKKCGIGKLSKGLGSVAQGFGKALNKGAGKQAKKAFKVHFS